MHFFVDYTWMIPYIWYPDMFAEKEVNDASLEITISTPSEFGNEMKLLKAWTPVEICLPWFQLMIFTSAWSKLTLSSRWSSPLSDV